MVWVLWVEEVPEGLGEKFAFRWFVVGESVLWGVHPVVKPAVEVGTQIQGDPRQAADPNRALPLNSGTET